jgi:DNA-binding MarR family transcriptional regulator
LISAEWGASEKNRRAKFYKLTPAGRKRFEAERDTRERFSGADSEESDRLVAVCAHDDLSVGAEGDRQEAFVSVPADGIPQLQDATILTLGERR